ALISYFIGSRERAGFKTKGYLRYYLYTKKVTHRSDWHEFKCMAELVRGITGNIADTRLEFWISDEDKQWVDEFIRKHNLTGSHLIVFHPGCGARYTSGARAREWPKENYIVLGNILNRKDKTYIIITGSNEELSLAEDIAASMENKPLVLAGKLDIGKLAALFERCNLLIVGDTGIMHLGCACGIRVIAIFGPSNPERWRPLCGNYSIAISNLSCMPCQLFGIDVPRCNTFKCINSVSVEKVLNCIKEIEIV
ncbi:glycosyltransferase family 9 protein, partial [bacterium]